MVLRVGVLGAGGRMGAEVFLAVGETLVVRRASEPSCRSAVVVEGRTIVSPCFIPSGKREDLSNPLLEFVGSDVSRPPVTQLQVVRSLDERSVGTARFAASQWCPRTPTGRGRVRPWRPPCPLELGGSMSQREPTARLRCCATIVGVAAADASGAVHAPRRFDDILDHARVFAAVRPLVTTELPWWEVHDAG